MTFRFAGPCDTIILPLTTLPLVCHELVSPTLVRESETKSFGSRWPLLVSATIHPPQFLPFPRHGLLYRMGASPRKDESDGSVETELSPGARTAAVVVFSSGCFFFAFCRA